MFGRGHAYIIAKADAHTAPRVSDPLAEALAELLAWTVQTHATRNTPRG